MPIEKIKKFLGHSKLETTQVYAESATEMIKESYRKAMAERIGPVRELLSHDDNAPGNIDTADKN